MQVGDKLIVSMYTSSPDGQDCHIGDELEVISITGNKITVYNVSKLFFSIILESALVQMTKTKLFKKPDSVVDFAPGPDFIDLDFEDYECWQVKS